MADDSNIIKLVLTSPEADDLPLVETQVTTTDYVTGVEAEMDEGNVRLTFWDKIVAYKDMER
jgi:hypothetical protein